MKETVILVAIQVDAEDETVAQALVMPHLRAMLTSSALINAWWIAEDNRIDGSDNDSAVFVNPGEKTAAARLLFRHGMTGYHNIPREAGE